MDILRQIYPIFTNKILRINTSGIRTIKLSSIFESIRSEPIYTIISFNLVRGQMSQHEYSDSLNDIGVFIDELLNNKLMLNLKELYVHVEHYDPMLVNFLGKISSLLNNRKSLDVFRISTSYFYNDYFHNDYGLDMIGSQAMVHELNNFLCSQRSIRHLGIGTYKLPDPLCLGFFEHLDLDLSSSYANEFGPFTENFIGMLDYNQNIKGLKIKGLPVEFLRQIIDVLGTNNSLEIFDMWDYYNEDYKLSESIANMIVNNKSIIELHIYIPYEYEKIVGSIAYNETLREIFFEPVDIIDDDRLVIFLSDLDKMLDVNFTLTKISYPKSIANLEPIISESINEKLARNQEIFHNIRFARTKSIF